MPEIGPTISHYKIIKKIGKGDMGKVYLAEDTNLDRKVALRFLPVSLTSNPERMARLDRETKLPAFLKHPNIAGIYDLEQADEYRFPVMELIEGQTLDSRIKTGAILVEQVLKLALRTTETFEAAHEKNMIRCDNMQIPKQPRMVSGLLHLLQRFAHERNPCRLWRELCKTCILQTWEIVP